MGREARLSAEKRETSLAVTFLPRNQCQDTPPPHPGTRLRCTPARASDVRRHRPCVRMGHAIVKINAAGTILRLSSGSVCGSFLARVRVTVSVHASVVFQSCSYRPLALRCSVPYLPAGRKRYVDPSVPAC